MNLLTDAWLPMRLRCGEKVILPLSALAGVEVVDFALPRLDFQNAAYQLAISVLQTLFAPDNAEQWYEHYQTAPSEAQLQEVFALAEHAFKVSGEGACFMQDQDLLLDANVTPIERLLIDAPGSNAIKKNTDFFIKREMVTQLSLPMAVMALFTLQINAPSGGSGHRVGLRGGGPMTTLLEPNAKANDGLWQRLWLNVMNREFWRYPDPDLWSASIFPWLGATHDSKGNKNSIYCDNVHPLHMYWAMPRRIRLQIEEEQGCCDISAKTVEKVVRQFRMKNYGNNYQGQWWHPLTPYRSNPKKPAEEAWTVKGQPGGITYKIWDLLTLSNQEEGNHAARVVEHFNVLCYEHFLDIEARGIWAFAFDLDNMKPRGIYQHQLPLMYIKPDEREGFVEDIRLLQTLAQEILKITQQKIKAAWFERPGDARGDLSVVDAEFWQRSESVFFNAVREMLNKNSKRLEAAVANKWLRQMCGLSEALFDEYVFSDPFAAAHSRLIQCRRELRIWLYGGKKLDNFRKQYVVTKEGSND